LAAKPYTLKVDNLLAQYLYQYKKLSLMGIGVFTLDDSAVLYDENAKTKAPIEGISFVSKSIGQYEDSLIEFIKAQTGKMKALAQADLDSYIMLAHQFLNIGKPFYLEGIGTLQKNRDGSFQFNPGTSIAVKTEDTDTKKKPGPVEESKPAEESSGRVYRALVLALGIIGTLLVIGWGGYYLYNKNADTGSNPVAENNLRVVADSQVSRNIAPDTVTHQITTTPTTAPAGPATTAVTTPPPVAALPAGSFKFILETPHKKRALYRYENIKDSRIVQAFNSKIQMETPDSVNFKIFVVIPCAPADTTRYKDSLNAWYYGSQDIKVKIEH
jgi:nucleoid DNA-binding protein